MCLNRARQRRRHRRAIEDWFHLSEHVISADGSPGFQDWLHSPASPWHWPPEQEVMLTESVLFSASLPAEGWSSLVEHGCAGEGPCHLQGAVTEGGHHGDGMRNI